MIQQYVAQIGNSLARKSDYHGISWEGQKKTWSVAGESIPINKYSEILVCGFNASGNQVLQL